MLFLVPKDDIHRHKILKILINKKASYQGQLRENVDCNLVSAKVDDIAKQIKVTPQKVRELAATLVSADEAVYCRTTNERGLLYTGTNAFESFSDHKYLKKGRAYRVSLIKDNLYIVVSFIAIVSSLSSLVLYITNTINVQKEVTELRKEVQELKTIVHPKAQQTK